MGYLNKLFAIGRVGKIYPSSTFQNGDKVVRFSLACSKVYKNANGETVEITKWWSIVAKNTLADLVISRLKIGEEIYIEGEPMDRTYTDREGNERTVSEVILYSLQFVNVKLGVPKENIHPSNVSQNEKPAPTPTQRNFRPQPQSQAEEAVRGAEGDDLPF